MAYSKSRMEPEKVRMMEALRMEAQRQRAHTAHTFRMKDVPEKIASGALFDSAPVRVSQDTNDAVRQQCASILGKYDDVVPLIYSSSAVGVQPQPMTPCPPPSDVSTTNSVFQMPTPTTTRTNASSRSTRKPPTNIFEKFDCADVQRTDSVKTTSSSTSNKSEKLVKIDKTDGSQTESKREYHNSSKDGVSQKDVVSHNGLVTSAASLQNDAMRNIGDKGSKGEARGVLNGCMNGMLKLKSKVPSEREARLSHGEAVRTKALKTKSHRQQESSLSTSQPTVHVKQKLGEVASKEVKNGPVNGASDVADDIAMSSSSASSSSSDSSDGDDTDSSSSDNEHEAAKQEEEKKEELEQEKPAAEDDSKPTSKWNLQNFISKNKQNLLAPNSEGTPFNLSEWTEVEGAREGVDRGMGVGVGQGELDIDVYKDIIQNSSFFSENSCSPDHHVAAAAGAAAEALAASQLVSPAEVRHDLFDATPTSKHGKSKNSDSRDKTLLKPSPKPAVQVKKSPAVSSKSASQRKRKASGMRARVSHEKSLASVCVNSSDDDDDTFVNVERLSQPEKTSSVKHSNGRLSSRSSLLSSSQPERGVHASKHGKRTGVSARAKHYSPQHDSKLSSRSSEHDNAMCSSKSNRHSAEHAVSLKHASTEHARSAKHASPSHSLKHASPTQSLKHASPTHSLKHASPTHSLKHASPAHALKHASPTQSLKHASPTHSLKHASPTHSLKHASPTHSLKHASPAHALKHASPIHSLKHASPTHSLKHASPAHALKHVTPVISLKPDSPDHKHSLKHTSADDGLSSKHAKRLHLSSPYLTEHMLDSPDLDINEVLNAVAAPVLLSPIASREPPTPGIAPPKLEHIDGQPSVMVRFNVEHWYQYLASKSRLRTDLSASQAGMTSPVTIAETAVTTSLTAITTSVIQAPVMTAVSSTAVTSSAVASSTVAISAVTSSAVPSTPVTLSAVTSTPVMSSAVTSTPVTSIAVTSTAFTVSAVLSSAVTSSAVMSSVVMKPVTSPVKAAVSSKTAVASSPVKKEIVTSLAKSPVTIPSSDTKKVTTSSSEKRDELKAKYQKHVRLKRQKSECANDTKPADQHTTKCADVTNNSLVSHQLEPAVPDRRSTQPTVAAVDEKLANAKKDGEVVKDQKKTVEKVNKLDESRIPPNVLLKRKPGPARPDAKRMRTIEQNGTTAKTNVTEKRRSTHRQGESFDFYLSLAKKTKHLADNMSEPVDKALTYAKACLIYMQAGYATERDNHADTSCVFKLYSDMLNLLKYNPRGGKHPEKERKLAVLRLRMQSALYLKLYKLKQLEVSKLKSIIDEYKSTSKQPAAPSPYRASGGSLNRSTGTPSPMSPQPSPAGSVGSVGSVGSANGEQNITKLMNGGTVVTSSGTFVSVPQRIQSVMDQYLGMMGYLRHCHDCWDKADSLMTDESDFFQKLEVQCGELTMQSTVDQFVRYINAGLDGV